jgi:hypothetical protein
VLSVAPRLQDYLSSPRGGAAWAKALYDTQSKGPALHQIAESLSTTDLGVSLSYPFHKVQKRAASHPLHILTFFGCQGYNKLQKLCNSKSPRKPFRRVHFRGPKVDGISVLQVLQPIPSQVPKGGWTADNEPYAQRLVAAVQGIQTDPFQMQFISISNDPFVVDEYQWLYDAMSALLQALFSDDPSVRLSGPTADALRKDAIDLAEATGRKDLETKDMHQ